MSTAQYLSSNYKELDDLESVCKKLHMMMFYCSKTDTFSYYFVDNSILKICGENVTVVEKW